MKADIKVIVGLGNPGPKYARNRHNIGFLVLNALAERYNAHWQMKDQYDVAELRLHDKMIQLIKPTTFMNTVGKIMPMLAKRGIKAEEILVIHDELEKPEGALQIRLGGSARGHNGLRSIIEYIGLEFYRLRFGIGRPEHKEDVGNWVLSNFALPHDQLQELIVRAIEVIVGFVNHH